MVRYNLLGNASHNAPQPIGQPFGPILSTGLFSRGAYVNSLAEVKDELYFDILSPQNA